MSERDIQDLNRVQAEKMAAARKTTTQVHDEVIKKAAGWNKPNGKQSPRT
jgi:hypothetical protein